MIIREAEVPREHKAFAGQKEGRLVRPALDVVLSPLAYRLGVADNCGLEWFLCFGESFASLSLTPWRTLPVLTL